GRWHPHLPGGFQGAEPQNHIPRGSRMGRKTPFMSAIRHHRLTASTGHRIGVAHMPTAECVAISVYLPVGSRHETPCVNEGIAHFIEHMVFKGTGRRNARAISLDAESAGGQLNAFTSEDHTVYEARGPAELFPLLAEILAD